MQLDSERLYTVDDVATMLKMPSMTIHQYLWNWGIHAPWATAMAIGSGDGGRAGATTIVRFWDIKGVLAWDRFVRQYPSCTSVPNPQQTPSTTRDYYSYSPYYNPPRPSTGAEKVFRSGSWGSAWYALRVA